MQSILLESQRVGANDSDSGSVRECDLEAIARAYDCHHETLGAFARRLLGDVQAAEDLVHDVFLMLPRVIRRLEPGRSLCSFLMGILANQAKHRARKARRQRRLIERISSEPRELGIGPEAELSEHRLAEALERALDRVSMDQRIAFILCAVEGRDSLEVAETLGIPEATVRTRLFYARQKLSKLLAKEGFG